MPGTALGDFIRLNFLANAAWPGIPLGIKGLVLLKFTLADPLLTLLALCGAIHLATRRRDPRAGYGPVWSGIVMLPRASLLAGVAVMPVLDAQ